MKNMLDSQRIEFPCPQCKRKLSESVGKLKTNPTLRCVSCGNNFQVEASQLKTGLAQVEKMMTDLQRTIGRLGK